MVRSVAQAFKAYAKSPATTTVTELIDLGSLEALEHTTKIPGGFGRLSFVMPAAEETYWEWRTNRLLFRHRLEEHGGYVIWEGRLEDIDLLDFWKMRVSLSGYWSNFTDAVYNPNYDTTGDVIVKDLRDTGLHADTDQLSTSNAEIAAPGVTIDIVYNEDWTVWRILTDRSRGILAFGNTDDQMMDLAVWEDRVIHYKARSPTSVDWITYVRPEHRAVKRLPARLSWKEVSNAVDTVYIDTSGSPSTKSRAGYAIDQPSIDKYIRREFHVTGLGDSDAATAQARRDTELALRKDIQQRTDNITITQVWDTNGAEWPLCRVRAGDVLRVVDFTPKTGDLGTVNLDAYRTFFIEETICRHDQGVLTIRPDREGTSLSSLIASGRTTQGAEPNLGL